MHFVDHLARVLGETLCKCVKTHLVKNLGNKVTRLNDKHVMYPEKEKKERKKVPNQKT